MENDIDGRKTNKSEQHELFSLKDGTRKSGPIATSIISFSTKNCGCPKLFSFLSSVHKFPGIDEITATVISGQMLPDGDK
ncbi:MAG: hypothetical protein WC575_04890 [Patescibacteria group bacterium]